MAQKTRSELTTLNINRIYENTSQDITGNTMQQHLQDIIDSIVFIDENTNNVLYEDITYSNLVSKITASELNIGQFYRIIDFVTKYEQPSTSIIKTGSTEPLLILAIKNNEINDRAFSETYPSDIIFYDITDNVCEDAVTNRNGKIYKRIDTVNNNVTPYDFREVEFNISGSDVLTFQGSCYNNIIEKSTSYDYNIISLNNSSNNKFNGDCYNIVLASNSNNNRFNNSINISSTTKAWNNNTVYANIDFNALDFSSATHINNSYSTTIYKRFDNTIGIKYIDSLDNEITDTVTN